MAETFATLQSKVADWLDRSDLTTRIKDFINMATHDAEQDYDWRHMESKSTGNLTSSGDTISLPTRYKKVKSLFITTNNEEKLLLKRSYKHMIQVYPDGSNVKNEPEMFATYEPDSVFVVRPYPNKTFAYTLTSLVYSADLSADADTNWFVLNAWEILLYGALLQAQPFVGKDERIPLWQEKYDTKIARLRRVFIDEKSSGSSQSAYSGFVV